MHLAWEEYQESPYYEYIVKKNGLDKDCPSTQSLLWWFFSKGYEAANKT
jgi:hypothetical protein